MTVERIGCGAGRREVRRTAERAAAVRRRGGSQTRTKLDRIWILETNLDDVPAEVIGYCFDQLFTAGALDQFSTPIQMKKNRPGVLLSVLASEAALPALEAVLFRETETFGVRRTRRVGASCGARR